MTKKELIVIKAIRKIVSRALGWVAAAWSTYEFRGCIVLHLSLFHRDEFE